LLEKSNQLGGRVQSKTIEGQEVDFGGFIIYPWYKNTHQLIKELQLKQKIEKLPDLDIFYSLKNQKKFNKDSNKPLTVKELLKLAFEFSSSLILDSDPSQPKTDAYGYKTIAEYIKNMHFPLKEERQFLKIFDTFLQGYCYGSVDEQKMALMASTIMRNFIRGDVHNSYFFPDGTSTLIEALKSSLQQRSVNIQLQKNVLKLDKKCLYTKTEKFSADAFILTHPIDSVYKNLFKKEESIYYTEFATIAIESDKILNRKNKSDWGAIFFQENQNYTHPVLSIINLESLYKTPLKKLYNLNVKLPKGKNFDKALCKKSINSQLNSIFEANCTKIVNYVHWTKTMPVAQESLVEEVNALQGKNGIFFAGDYLGCPSMETAIGTGVRAARTLKKHFKL